jgi:hypothetical protein
VSSEADSSFGSAFPTGGWERENSYSFMTDLTR